MAPTPDSLWRSLRPGDRVQIVHYPCEFSDQEYTMHDETRAAYRHLIDTKEVLQVSYLDDDGFPWVEFQLTDLNGDVQYHSLMLNHEGIHRVGEDI
jgi:hypothetical protein